MARIRFGEGCCGCVILVMVGLCFLIALAGCKTCEPEIKTVEVKVPVLSCPAPEKIEALELPEMPEPPADDSETALKQWYAECVKVILQREALLSGRVQLLQDMLQAYEDLAKASDNTQPDND